MPASMYNRLFDIGGYSQSIWRERERIQIQARDYTIQDQLINYSRELKYRRVEISQSEIWNIAKSKVELSEIP